MRARLGIMNFIYLVMRFLFLLFLTKKLSCFNQNLIRDSTDIDMSSHGDSDLKKIVQYFLLFKDIN